MRWIHGLALATMAALAAGCATGDAPVPAGDAAHPLPVVEYDSFPRLIPVPMPTPEDREVFFPARQGDVVTVTKEDGVTFTGHVTENAAFLRAVLMPALLPHREQLAAMDPVDQINALTLFGHETYRTWFGRDAFAWGGHVHDLDDPQESGPNFQNRFGLDCSGFAALPYELALELELMGPGDPAAVWTSRGFELYARAHGLKDRGGRGGTSNNWRVDTVDMTQLGREIFKVPKGGAPRDEDLALLQPGDLILAPGHVGLAVEINGAPYYLEHGGWVCPPNGALPFAMREAMVIFAEKGELTVRRSLPDRVR
jgi:hypothetical protein